MNSHQCKESTAANKYPALAIRMSHPEHAQVQQHQRSQSVGSIGQSNQLYWLPERGTGNPTSLEELGDLSQLSVLLTLLLQRCTAALLKPTCHRVAHEGLAGVCILGNRQTDLIFPSVNHNFNLKLKHPWMTTLAVLVSQPHWIGLSCLWVAHCFSAH